MNLRLAPTDHRGGLSLSCGNDARAISWPFHKNTSVDGARNTTIIAGSFFDGNPDRFSAGLSVGKDVANGSDWWYAEEVSGCFPWGIRGRLGISSVPGEWDISAHFDSTITPLPAMLRSTVSEGRLTVPVLNVGEMTAHGSSGEHRASDTSRGALNSHAQIIDSYTASWGVDFKKKSLSREGWGTGYSRYRLNGHYELRFDGEQYLRCSPRLDGYRIWSTFSSKRLPFGMREIKFNRVSSHLGFRHGRVDSWPFTPVQISIVGDKTWTFSGTGRIALNAVTVSWADYLLSGFSISGGRAYFDYRLRVVERDHLSLDPFEMLFGTSRVETDRIRYTDFALIHYEKELRKKRTALLMEFQQIVPLRQVKNEKKKGTKARIFSLKLSSLCRNTTVG